MKIREYNNVNPCLSFKIHLSFVLAIARTYFPFVLAGKNDPQLTMRLLQMMPNNIQVKLSRNGMIHMLPLQLQYLLLGNASTTKTSSKANSGADYTSLISVPPQQKDVMKIFAANITKLPLSVPPPTTTTTTPTQIPAGLGQQTDDACHRQTAQYFKPMRPTKRTNAPSQSHYTVNLDTKIKLRSDAAQISKLPSKENDTNVHVSATQLLKIIIAAKWKKASAPLANDGMYCKHL